MGKADRNRLIDLLHELRVLAVQAKQRGDARIIEPTPGYWYDAQLGQNAAQRQENVSDTRESTH
jgi:virulence-associated protein VagC